MNAEVKTKWVAALKSGEYEQGVGQLRDGNEFCCLGVLCDLYAKEYGVPWGGACFMGQSQVLPLDVVAWAGLEDRNPDIDHFGPIAELNDDGASFATLAKLIETDL